MTAPGGGGSPDDERVRRWLTNLRRPDRLDEPALRELLRVHGRDAAGSPLQAGRAAADLLREKIDALRPPEGTAAFDALPYRVLKTCFVEGAKSYQAAARLGVSERQLSRERSRAVALLAAELAAAPRRAAPVAPAEPPGLVPRPEPAARLDEALAAATRVHVTGAAGAGKTALVGAWAAGAERVFWHTFVPHLDRGPASLLFELGEHLAPEDPSLASYLRAALPSFDAGLACRIALATLRHAPRLFVLDDFHVVAHDAATTRLLDALAGAPAPSRVVTIGRGPVADVRTVTVPALSRAEVGAVLAARGVTDALAEPLHAWTRGNARLVDAAATWLASGSAASFEDATRDGDAVVRNLAGLMWQTRRAAA